MNSHIQSWKQKDRYEKVEVIVVTIAIIVLITFAVVCS